MFKTINTGENELSIKKLFDVLNILIKLMTIVSLVFAPLIIKVCANGDAVQGFLVQWFNKIF